MKKYLSFVLILSLLYACALGEQAPNEDASLAESIIGLWEADVPVYFNGPGIEAEPEPQSVHTVIEFTADGTVILYERFGEMSFSYTEDTVSVNNGISISFFGVPSGELDDFSSFIMPQFKAEYHYEILDDKLIWYQDLTEISSLFNAFKQTYEVYQRTKGEAGILSTWRLYALIDEEQLDAFVNHGEGMENLELTEYPSLYMTFGADGVYNKGYEVYDYTVEDDVITATPRFAPEAGSAMNPMNFRFAVEDGVPGLYASDGDGEHAVVYRKIP